MPDKRKVYPLTRERELAALLLEFLTAENDVAAMGWASELVELLALYD